MITTVDYQGILNESYTNWWNDIAAKVAEWGIVKTENQLLKDILHKDGDYAYVMKAARNVMEDMAKLKRQNEKLIAERDEARKWAIKYKRLYAEALMDNRQLALSVLKLGNRVSELEDDLAEGQIEWANCVKSFQEALNEQEEKTSE